MIQPWYLDPSLLKIRKPRHQNFQASLKEFFTEIPDKTFPKLVGESYLNFKIEGSVLITYVSEVEITLHKNCFEKTFEFLLWVILHPWYTTWI